MEISFIKSGHGACIPLIQDPLDVGVWGTTHLTPLNVGDR